MQDLLTQAQAGDAEAQHLLGRRYHYGDGVDQSYATAMVWYRRAAAQNLAKSQNNLGILFSEGLGVERDSAEAARWFLRGAHGGSTNSACSLGQQYYRGDGVEQNLVEAAKWFRAAAERGNPVGENWMGLFHREGLGGVPLDAGEAARWFLLSANQGNAEAEQNLGTLYCSPALPNPAEGVRWLRSAALKGRPVAQYNLGGCYFEGELVPKSDTEAFKWFAMAAEQDLPEAQSFLGYLYKNGLGVAQDNEQALKWLRLAVRAEVATAQHNLANMFAAGQGVPADQEEAFDLYSLAAHQGFDAAQYSLGMAYANGVGVARDAVQAKRWLQAAAAQGFQQALDSLRTAEHWAHHQDALALIGADQAREGVSALQQLAQAGYVHSQHSLAVAYEEGYGVAPDVVQAIYWYVAAAKQGNAASHNNLGVIYLSGAFGHAEPAKALKCFEEAHSRSYPIGSFNLARMHANGWGIPKDEARAAALYLKATEGGHIGAGNNLGLLHAMSESPGVRDLTLARRWLSWAASRGDTLAGANLKALQAKYFSGLTAR